MEAPIHSDANSRVLVTGGTGFLGRHVVGALTKGGAEVHVAARNADVKSSPGAQFHAVDLLKGDRAALLVEALRPDIVVHLAWCASPGAFWTDPANVDWSAATLRLARAAAANGVRRFVATGTCFEYAWPSEAPCVEGVTPLAAHTLYDAAKSAAFGVLTPFFAATDTQFAWARVFYLYGPGENPNRFIASLARSLARGEPARCSSGVVRRDFLDTRDAGAAIAALAQSAHEGPVNIGSGRAPRLRDIAQMLAELAGRPDLLQVGALPDRPGEPPCIVADTTILRQRIGFVPRHDLEDGLKAAIEEARAREAR